MSDVEHPCDCDCVDCVRDQAMTPDAVVDHIPPECAGEQGLVVFRGFLGNKGESGDKWRLYLSLGMRDWIEIDDDDIVARHPAGGGSLVWVPSRRLVRYIRVRTAEALQAEFLEGEIARRRGTSTRDKPTDTGAGGVVASDTWDCPRSLTYTACNPH